MWWWRINRIEYLRLNGLNSVLCFYNSTSGHHYPRPHLMHFTFIIKKFHNKIMLDNYGAIPFCIFILILCSIDEGVLSSIDHYHGLPLSINQLPNIQEKFYKNECVLKWRIYKVVKLKFAGSNWCWALMNPLLTRVSSPFGHPPAWGWRPLGDIE